MSNDRLIVTGDRFGEFSAHRGTAPVSVVLEGLRAGTVSDGVAIVVGQGLSDGQLVDLVAAGERRGSVVAAPTRARRDITHKHEGRNVMIGPPRRAGEADFVADLVIDERNEVLEDHLTGQHIPAVALIEATRQMWTAVTEQFLLAGDAPTRFVVASVGGRFERYVFPLPATLELQVVERERGPVGEVFRTRTLVRQLGTTAAEIESEYRVVPEALSAKQESLAARAAIRTCLADGLDDGLDDGLRS